MFRNTYSYGAMRYHGCWCVFDNRKQFLPQVQLNSVTTILSPISHTTLTQTFYNPQKQQLNEAQYSFPLYDGVSVVAFQCKVADRTITGVVKEKFEARAEYKEAVDRGETAGLLEQAADASDVFTTRIGNVPAEAKVVVEITYLGELKNDAESDGARFTIPTVIAPRYGSTGFDTRDVLQGPTTMNDGGISILVDIMLEEGAAIKKIQSPSHPIAVTIGHTSGTADDETTFTSNHGSATLTLGKTALDKDFVLIVLGQGLDTPQALLETHPSILDQRAIMTTLVPKFNLPNIHPEIVFVVDRSGSMEGKMHLVIDALKVFLKSLPVGVKFNIWSFGSHYNRLFDKSRTYDESSLREAMNHLNPQTFTANFGGTEMLKPIKAIVHNRFNDLPLEVMLLTDGEIWNQQEMFDYINESSKQKARFFTLGVGSGASSALVEGVARAGNGFSQWVEDGEKIDKRIVRMLKAALTPHVDDYTLEVTYATPEKEKDDDEFTLVESFNTSMEGLCTEKESKPRKSLNPISLFNTSSKDEPTNPPAGRYDHLPLVEVPKILQAPHEIPGIYPHQRLTVYLILGPDSNQAKPESVTLRGTTVHGPLELEIPVKDVGKSETIHQMAAKKAVHEIEQGRGWITVAKNKDGSLMKSKNEGNWDMIVEREAVRLGVQFQVGGKNCSFVAIERNISGHIGREGANKSELSAQELLAANVANVSVRGDRLDAVDCCRESMASREFSAPKAKRASFGLFNKHSGSKSGSSFGGFGFNSTTPSGGSLLGSGNANIPAGGFFGSSSSPSAAARGGSRPVFSAQMSKKESSSAGLFGNPGGIAHTGSASSRAARKSAPSASAFAFSVPPPAQAAALAPPPPPPAPSRQRAPAPAQYDPTIEDEGGQDEYHVASSLSSIQHMKMKMSQPQQQQQTRSQNPQDIKSMTISQKMHKLIELQLFSGAWMPDDALLDVFGFRYAQELTMHKAFEGLSDVAVKATCAAIAWLEVHVPEEEDVYEMVVDKAKDWLSSQGVDAKEWTTRAKQLW